MAKSSKDSGRQARPGYVLLVAPDGVTAASTNGVEYPVGEDGLIEVPAAGVVQLLDHGFARADGAA